MIFFAKHTMARSITMAVAVLILSVLLTACETNQPAPAQSENTVLPAAAQVKPPTKVPPTPTPLPTPTSVVLLLDPSHPTPEPFRKGEPAALSNLQDELATQAAKYFPPTAGKPKSGSVSTTLAAKLANTPVAAKPTTAPAGRTNTPIASQPKPPAAGNWVYDAGNWHVSTSYDDIIIDNYDSGRYVIVGLLVKNTGKSSQVFNSLGLQLQFKSSSTALSATAAPESVVLNYLKANNLTATGSTTVFAAVPPDGQKVVYAAFLFPAVAEQVRQIVLVSTTTKGLNVPVYIAPSS